MDFQNIDLEKNDVFRFNVPIHKNILKNVKDNILGNVVDFNFFYTLILFYFRIQ